MSFFASDFTFLRSYFFCRIQYGCLFTFGGKLILYDYESISLVSNTGWTYMRPQLLASISSLYTTGFKQKHWLSEELFPHIIHIQTYNWTMYVLCESNLNGGIQAEAMACRISFPKLYTLSNIQLNKVCALRKYSEWRPSSRSNGFQKNFFHTLYTFKHTIEQCMCSVKVIWMVGFKQKQWLAEEIFFWNIIHMQTYNWTKYALCGSTLIGWLQAEAMASRRKFSEHSTYSNIQLNKICTLNKYSECWASSTSKGFLKKFFETIYTFKHAIDQSMHSVKVHWAVGFRQKQGLSEEVFWKILHIQTYNNKVCILWKYTGWWASSRSNGSQKKFFEPLQTCKHTNEQIMCSVKVHWVVGFKQKQWLAEEGFWNIIHMQTYNWTKYALCGSTLIGWPQAEAMAFRRTSSLHYTHSNIQLNNVCALWK